MNINRVDNLSFYLDQSIRKWPNTCFFTIKFLKEEYGIIHLNRNVKRFLFISESLKVQNTDFFFQGKMCKSLVTYYMYNKFTLSCYVLRNPEQELL